MSRRLRVAAALPHHGASFPGSEASWRRVLDAARQVEGAGIGAVWTADGGNQPSFDPLVVAAALAALTENLDIGVMVALDRLAPSVLAKAAASLDRLSGGRLSLGFAATTGDEPADDDDGGRLEEAVELVRAMLRDERTTFQGRYYAVTDAPNLPRPVQRPFPVWIAARTDAALRTAARCGDGWHLPEAGSPAAYAERAAEFARACEEVGRDPAQLRRSAGVTVLVGEDEDDLVRRFRAWQALAPEVLGGITMGDFLLRGLVGVVARVGELLAEYESLGVEELVGSFAPVPFGWFPDSGLELLTAAGGTGHEGG